MASTVKMPSENVTLQNIQEVLFVRKFECADRSRVRLIVESVLDCSFVCTRSQIVRSIACNCFENLRHSGEVMTARATRALWADKA